MELKHSTFMLQNKLLQLLLGRRLFSISHQNDSAISSRVRTAVGCFHA